MHKYLEIKEHGTNKVVFRLDVTFLESGQAGKLHNETNSRLNHDKYSLELNESEIELEKIG